MKNVIAAAALSLVLSDFAYANEQRDEAMMKITPSTLVDADIQAVSPALARFGREAISKTSGNVTPSRPRPQHRDCGHADCPQPARRAEALY
jgi:hypothetical protein